MYCVMSQIKKEWLIFMPSNKLDRLVSFAVGEIFTLSAGFKRWDVWSFGVSVVGVEVAGRLAVVTAGDVEVKTLLIGVPGVRAKVPFADVAGGVAGWFEGFGDGNLVQFHPEGIGRAQQFSVFAAYIFGGIFLVWVCSAAPEVAEVDPVGNASAGWVASCHHGCPCG